MRHIRRPRPLVLALVFLLACGGSDGPTGSTGSTITLEGSKAVSDSIGPAGGALTAHAGSGVTYTLTIPAGALLSPTKITLTPIAAQQGLPVSGGFAAGVDLAPAGLHFARAAQLSITPAPTPPAGQVAAAVTFEGQGNALGLTLLAAGPNGLLAQVTHFSGVSVVFGTTADLQSLAATQVQTGSASQPFVDNLAVFPPPDASNPTPAPETLPILQDWFATVILPELQQAGTDAELLLAVGDYDQWAQGAVLYLTGQFSVSQGVEPPTLPAALATEQAQAATAAAAALRQAVAGNNSTCLTQHSFQALLNVIYWQGTAQYFGVDTPVEQLDVPSLLPGLCAQFVAESIGLVDPLPLGQTVSFDQVWAVEIGSSPPVLPADFFVSITATGPVNVSTPSGFTGPDPQGGAITQGFYTTVVTGQQAGNADFQVQACLVSPFSGSSQPFASGFCGTTDVLRQIGSGGGSCGGGTLLNSPIITNAAELAAIADVSQIDGSLNIRGDSTLSQVVLPCLRYVQSFIQVGGFTGVNPLLSSVEFPALDSTGFIAVDADTALTTLRFPVLRQLGHRANQDVGFLRIGESDQLTTVEIPAVKILSFSDFGVTGSGGGLQIVQPLRDLTALSGFASGITADTFFFSLDTLSATSFTEAEALDLANRGNFKGVCQLLAGPAKQCYQGPPWH